LRFNSLGAAIGKAGVDGAGFAGDKERPLATKRERRFWIARESGRYLTRPTYTKHARVAATGFNYGTEYVIAPARFRLPESERGPQRTIQ
jgi:hypothetical protein